MQFKSVPFLTAVNCLYALIDTRNNEVFYIGVTKDPYGRVDAHFWDGRGGSTPKARRIAEIHRAGKKVIFRIISRYKIRLEAERAERDLIKLLAKEPWRSLLIVQGVDPFTPITQLDAALTNVTHNPGSKRKNR